MNDHKSACFLIILLIAGMLFGVNSLRNASTAAREVANGVRLEAEGAEQRAQLSDFQLKSLDSKTSELRTVYTEWTPYFESCRTPQEAEQKIVEVIRHGDVFTISQKFSQQELEREDQIKSALVADLVVEDDYAKALNWLGEIEKSIPHCRISKCVIMRGDRGNDVHMDVQVQIPILLADAEG